jgi:FkbM family methyltransferase|tara:strand:- start:46 stop:678 length:633 start_codon:yes stop_codon:yes gene_type:complete
MNILNSFFSQKFKTELKKFRKFNALNQLDKKMLNYINFSEGFFIECGANDGVNQSNTWYFEKYLNWHGILIEPLSDQFIELKKNRSQKNYFYNLALSSSQKINSLNIIENNLTSKVTNKLDKKTKVSKFYSTTLTKILDEIDAPKLVDFFSLDVEGYEEQVIKGINFKKYNFKFFLVETKNDIVIKLIESKNYKLVKKMSYHDYLFHYTS